MANSSVFGVLSRRAMEGLKVQGLAESTHPMKEVKRGD